MRGVVDTDGTRTRDLLGNAPERATICATDQRPSVPEVLWPFGSSWTKA